MSLNIKNPETHQIDKELSSLTGESVTQAVTVALRERLHRVKRERDTDMVERIMAIARDAAPRFKELSLSTGHGELLYDEDGLPK